MRLGILVNVLDSGDAGATTYRLATEGVNRGHDVWVIGTGSFSYEPDDSVGGLARTVPPGDYTEERFLSVFKSSAAIERWINFDHFDVLLLRNNPSVQSAWAQMAGINFGRFAMRRGVVVLNDPNGLSKATNKLYLQTFPEEVRPRTLVTRSVARIKEFLDQEGTIILKPLQGSGGQGVFRIRRDGAHNLEGVFQSVSRDGYVIAQEYLAAAEEGDTRLFIMNGSPLSFEGKYAAFRRIRAADDVRSNIHAGGKLRPANVDATMLRVAEVVRPRLVEDGMFLVGLDIAGDKLLEVNVFSPGGLGSAQKFEKVNFCQAVIEALERKVRYVEFYKRHFSNVDMAIL